MKLKIKYNPELGLPDFVSDNKDTGVESPMAIFLQCKDGKKRNADATLKETILSMFFATRGLYNIFDSDISSIEVDGIKGLKKAAVLQQNQNNSEVVFHSRYKVCNWKVSLGSIDEFFYITHHSSDSQFGTIKYRETYANKLRENNLFSQFIVNSDVISDYSVENFKKRMFVLATAFQHFNSGLKVRIENNSLVFLYNGRIIQDMDAADEYIKDDETYTIFLYTNLLLNRTLNYDRYDMVYIDAQNMSENTLNLFRMITQILKNDNNGLDQNVNLIFYNLTKSQIDKLKGDSLCQIIELPNSRDARESANLVKEK